MKALLHKDIYKGIITLNQVFEEQVNLKDKIHKSNDSTEKPK